MVFLIGNNLRVSIFCAATTIVLFCVLVATDLSGVPAFNVIKVCMPEDRIVTLLYKFMLSVNCVVPAFLTGYLSPTKVFAEIKHLLFSGFIFLVILMGLYIGVPVRRADGAAVVFSNLFCESAEGAIFVILMIGMGAFFCILYFFYTCKSIYLLKIRGV